MDKEEIVEKTWLSPREAELYKKIEEGLSIRKAGKQINMNSEGQALKTYTRIKEKLRKSKNTLENVDLDINLLL